MGAGAASKKSVNVGGGGGGGALRLAAVINDANGCFASEADFGLALAGTGTNNCIGVIMAAGGGGGRTASLVFHSSLKYFELFVYII